MNQYRIFFVQTFPPIPSMHRKLTKLEKSCMQNNQLLTKTLVELKNDSDMYVVVAEGVIIRG